MEIPFITVGIVVLNREWIIAKTLTSLKNQTYPHNKIFILIVDGESNDQTVNIAKQALEKSDFKGYKIIVKKSSIPEARNICIKNMQGDFLLFWDSDVIMEPDAISALIATMKKEKVDIVTADSTAIFVNSIDEIDERLKEEITKRRKEEIFKVPAVSMGQTIISKNVFNSVVFDVDLTVLEDFDFSLRARQAGFQMVINKGIKVFDVNIFRKAYSDIHIDMPLKDAIRGIRKKAKAQILACNFKLTWKDTVNFFLINKRYLFYLGYIPTFILLIQGIFVQNLFLATIFPAYLLVYLLAQLKKRGPIKSFKALIRSFLVGLPTVVIIIYYSILVQFKNAQNFENHNFR
ncbi:MAG: glycosyltransferase [Candidatus Bathyarchaeia archaeon]